MSPDRESDTKKSNGLGTSSNLKPLEMTPNKKTKCKVKGSKKRKRRRSRSSDTDDEEDEIDSSIDDKLNECAQRNNLTPQNVKNILQKVVKNDHVLAIVKLKEEKLKREEQARKRPKLCDEQSNEDDKEGERDNDDDGDSDLPKLTRAKAKALNKFPLPLVPLKHSEPDSEVIALIREELGSDDEDEEYQPNEDDIESDDDLNTTASDFDSQPATPMSQIDLSEDHSQTPKRAIFTKDGLFKVPRDRNDSTASQTEQEYIIAKQTRSKVSLAETPIEAIESTFLAPDAPLDIYEAERENEPDWIEFLTGFSMPLNTDMEKDEETDPDYHPDKQFVDREEFQAGNVSKKELNDLLNEIYESLIEGHDLVHNDIDTHQANVQSATDDLITPHKDLNQQLTTPETSKIESPQQAPNDNSSQFALTNTSITVRDDLLTSTYFDPNVMSTPARPPDKPSYSQQTVNYSMTQYSDTANSTLISANETSTHYTYQYPVNTFSPMKDNTTPILLPIISLNATPNQTIVANGLMQSSPSVYLAMQSFPQTSFDSSVASNNLNCSIHQPEQNAPQKTRAGSRSKRNRFKSALYSDLEGLDAKMIPTYENRFVYGQSGFTAEQRQVLDQQLRMYVQLSTQHYIQMYGHPEFYPRAPKIKRNLIELDEIVDKNDQLTIVNLKPALKLVGDWENELSTNSTENTQFVRYLEKEMDKLRGNLSYTMQFHDRVLKLIGHSKVFMYPELLPKIPFRFDTKKLSEFIPAEDYLLAFLLEHFYAELQYQMESYKFAKPKEVRLALVCRHIAAHFNYVRQSKSIYDYVRLRKNYKYPNPIKFYFENKRAPPYRHRLETFNEHEIVEPAKHSLSKLTDQWQKFVQNLIGHSHDKILRENSVASALQSIESKQHKPDDKNRTKVKKLGNKKANSSFPVHKQESDGDLSNANTTVNIKVLYEPNTHRRDSTAASSQCLFITDSGAIKVKPDINYEQSQFNNSNCSRIDVPTALDKGQKLLTSYFSVQRKPIVEKEEEQKFEDSDDITIDLTPEPPDFIKTEKNESNTSKVLLNYRKQVRRKYFRLRRQKHLLRLRLIKRFARIFSNSRKKLTESWHQYESNKNLLFVYQSICTYNLYSSAIVEIKEMTKRGVTVEASSVRSHAIDTIMVNRRAEKLVQESTEFADEHNNPSHLMNETAAKRLPKSHRANENVRQKLLAENQQESAEKDFLFAQHFLDRVEERLSVSGNNDSNHHKFAEFINILRCFNESNETTASLYLRVEKFFLPDHPDLADLFLNFLMPSDAVEIGKFMEYFINTNFTKFISKLNICFQKQPAQIRKILTCIKELSEEDDLTMERIKCRVLPLLKGNQLLIDWFLQCMGTEQSMPSNRDEYETLALRKSNETMDDDAEMFEYIPSSEILPDPNDNPCHIRYLNCRLFYGTRFPLPAKLSFSAVPCSSNDPIDTSEHKHSIDKNASTSYRCVHNIKHFGDSKIRDITKNHAEFDQMGNNVSEEFENSDDEHMCSTPIDKMEEKNSFEEEAELTSPTASNTATNNDVLCDDVLLRAHSIRLNPSINQNTELLNRLKQPNPTDSPTPETSKEVRLSPKKLLALKCSTTTQAKQPPIRKMNSPNSKKTNQTAACRSPNTKKTTSPTLSQSASSPEGSMISSSESNAIQTAKRLKKILEAPPSTSGQTSTSPPDDIKRVAAAQTTKLKKVVTATKPLKKQKRFQEMDIDQPTQEATNGNDDREKSKNESEVSEKVEQTDTNETPSITWSRDEDRLLLEQIKNGLHSNVDGNASITFPGKTPADIRARIDFLIDFLTQLRNRT